jgi:hypothetical protein
MGKLFAGERIARKIKTEIATSGIPFLGEQDGLLPAADIQDREILVDTIAE